MNKFKTESDYDILVLVTKKTKELRDKIDEIVWEIAWEHNVVITAFIYEKLSFENDRFRPIYEYPERGGFNIVKKDTELTRKLSVIINKAKNILEIAK